MGLLNFFARYGKKLLVLMGIISLAIVVVYLVALRREPLPVKQAQKATDIAVSSAETTIASADEAITRTYEAARKKVMTRNESIRKDVQALSPGGVAAGLMALLDEYRGERERGN